jgi:hypothetical protein
MNWDGEFQLAYVRLAFCGPSIDAGPKNGDLNPCVPSLLTGGLRFYGDLELNVGKWRCVLVLLESDPCFDSQGVDDGI